ncbi:MAG: acyl-CoA dehydrogenase [Anaerolineales bacterium]|nr:acyl-CoA dehydrogenase [Anaerolineales bacterium]
MDFSLSEEQEMFRTMFRDFSLKEVAPIAEEIDQQECAPLSLLRKAAGQGFLGAPLPEEYGGAALDSVSYALLIETLARHSLSVAVTLAAHTSLVALSLLTFGTGEQKDAWLPLLTGGELIGAFGLTEPEAGSDTGAIASRAVIDGDRVVLNGTKTWVANGEIAGLFLVFARAAGGVEAFLVPRDAPGLTVGYREPTLGLRSVTFNTVYLESCRVPLSSRLAGPGQGAMVAERALGRLAVDLAAAALGVSEEAVEVAADFASERVQFGGPIGQKQAIQQYVGEASIEVEALRYLAYHAAWMADQGGEYSFDASAAKAFGARVARSVTNAMLQVLGGYGYMEDYPLARKYRDARALGLMGGPTELHQVQVARSIFAQRDLAIEY